MMDKNQTQILVNAALENLSPDISESTAFFFNSLPTQEAAESLQIAWEGAGNEMVRSRAFDGLMKLSGFDAVAWLINLFDRASQEWQTVCAVHLGDKDDDRALEKLSEIALSHSDADIRYVAVESLGRIGNHSTIPILQSVAERDSGIDYEGFTIHDAALEAIHKITMRSD